MRGLELAPQGQETGKEIVVEKRNINNRICLDWTGNRSKFIGSRWPKAHGR